MVCFSFDLPWSDRERWFIVVFCWVVDLERQNGDRGCKIYWDPRAKSTWQTSSFTEHGLGLRWSVKKMVEFQRQAACTGIVFSHVLSRFFFRNVCRFIFIFPDEHRGAVWSSCCTVHAFMRRTNGYGRSWGKGWTHWEKDGVGGPSSQENRAYRCTC